MRKKQIIEDVKCRLCGGSVSASGKKVRYICNACGYQPLHWEFRDDYMDIYIAQWLYKIYCNDYKNKKYDLNEKYRPTPHLTINQIATLLGKHPNTTLNWATANHENPYAKIKMPKEPPSKREILSYTLNRKNTNGHKNNIRILYLLGIKGSEAANKMLKSINKAKSENLGAPKKPKLIKITKEQHIESETAQKIDWIDDNDIADFGWVGKEDKKSYVLEQSRIRMENAITEYDNKVAAVSDFCKKAFEFNYPIEHRKDAVLWFGIITGCSFGELIGAKFSDLIENDRFIHLTRYVKFPKKLKRPYSKGKAIIGFDYFDVIKQEYEIEIIENYFDSFYLVDDRATRMLDYLQEKNRRHKQLNPNYDYSNDDYICLDENGKRYYTNELNARLAILCKKLGAANLEFNDFTYYRLERKL